MLSRAPLIIILLAVACTSEAIEAIYNSPRDGNPCKYPQGLELAQNYSLPPVYGQFVAGTFNVDGDKFLALLINDKDDDHNLATLVELSVGKNVKMLRNYHVDALPEQDLILMGYEFDLVNSSCGVIQVKTSSDSPLLILSLDLDNFVVTQQISHPDVAERGYFSRDFKRIYFSPGFYHQKTSYIFDIDEWQFIPWSNLMEHVGGSTILVPPHPPRIYEMTYDDHIYEVIEPNFDFGRSYKSNFLEYANGLNLILDSNDNVTSLFYPWGIDGSQTTEGAVLFSLDSFNVVANMTIDFQGSMVFGGAGQCKSGTKLAFCSGSCYSSNGLFISAWPVQAERWKAEEVKSWSTDGDEWKLGLGHSLFGAKDGAIWVVGGGCIGECPYFTAPVNIQVFEVN